MAVAIVGCIFEAAEINIGREHVCVCEREMLIWMEREKEGKKNN